MQLLCDLIHAHLFQAGNLGEILAHTASPHHQDVNDDDVAIVIEQPAKKACQDCAGHASGGGGGACALLCE